MKTILVGNGPREVSLYADSAVGRDAQPLFIPDVDGAWCVSLALAYRVGRLGKCIPEKFGHRYIDGMSVVALLHPEALPPQAGAVPGWLSIMDSAVTTGRWIEPRYDDGRCTETDALKALSDASALATLKTGDVIIPPQALAGAQRLEPNQILTASIGGEEVIRIKVK